MRANASADIDSFFDGFDESLRKGVDALQDAGADESTAKYATRVEFMTRFVCGLAPLWLILRSDGGLTDVKTFSGLKSILSGPAGGVVGCALTSWDDERKTPVIGLDMVRPSTACHFCVMSLGNTL